ncbi:hypothetical protein HK099_001037 [Clydaea vesicula]|uniref:Methyltransferase domain-containing protein n=1 Tax=Clydaea vesicula TaxID=447962 RepID=A0AAD5U895_9FUNG|nr:hypothetical protein HK099_001037 [Clydaea vesicula]
MDYLCSWFDDNWTKDNNLGVCNAIMKALNCSDYASFYSFAFSGSLLQVFSIPIFEIILGLSLLLILMRVKKISKILLRAKSCVKSSDYKINKTQKEIKKFLLTWVLVVFLCGLTNVFAQSNWVLYLFSDNAVLNGNYYSVFNSLGNLMLGIEFSLYFKFMEKVTKLIVIGSGEIPGKKSIVTQLSHISTPSNWNVETEASENSIKVDTLENAFPTYEAAHFFKYYTTTGLLDVIHNFLKALSCVKTGCRSVSDSIPIPFFLNFLFLFVLNFCTTHAVLIHDNMEITTKYFKRSKKVNRFYQASIYLLLGLSLIFTIHLIISTCNKYYEELYIQSATQKTLTQKVFIAQPGNAYQEESINVWKLRLAYRNEQKLLTNTLNEPPNSTDFPYGEMELENKRVLVYSIGSNAEYSFEIGINMIFDGFTDIYTFDMKEPKEPPPIFINLHPFTKLISEQEELENHLKQKIAGPRQLMEKSLLTLTKDLRHEDNVIDILKIDIEGCSFN